MTSKSNLLPYNFYPLVEAIKKSYPSSIRQSFKMKPSYFLLNKFKFFSNDTVSKMPRHDGNSSLGTLTEKNTCGNYNPFKKLDNQGLMT